MNIGKRDEVKQYQSRMAKWALGHALVLGGRRRICIQIKHGSNSFKSRCGSQGRNSCSFCCLSPAYLTFNMVVKVCREFGPVPTDQPNHGPHSAPRNGGSPWVWYVLVLRTRFHPTVWTVIAFHQRWVSKMVQS